ncbi:hypothetical protein DXZ20_32795 [Leptolyngbyaceae cyanobacterium CCMR0081]|uniref:Uncharacterized protein n=1 Tax=Adonisia turfae CCMR0081 TaxID=2292702 RepID=A0A6M0RWS3_9CYAN|nr:hypothetical protein [Adonisia turfae CCMR0081]
MPYKEPGLNLKRQLNLRRPLNLKPAPTPQQGHGLSNALNRSLQRHQHNFSQRGNRTSTSGPRGTTQSAQNITKFGSQTGNVASNSGTATTGSARTAHAIQTWNAAKRARFNAPQGTNPLHSTAANGTTLSAGAAVGGGSILFTPVASNPAGVVATLGTAALGIGLYAGNKLYEGMGSPFGPSLGEHLKAALGKNDQQLEPSTQASKPIAEGLTHDPETYGEAGKKYTVTYRTKSDYGPDHSEGPQERPWRESKTLTGKTGPIGTAVYRNPNSQPEGKHYFKGITGGNAHRDHQFYGGGDLLDMGFITGTGTNNRDVFVSYLEILDVVPLDDNNNPSGAPVEPQVITPSKSWPDISELPDFSGDTQPPSDIPDTAPPDPLGSAEQPEQTPSNPDVLKGLGGLPPVNPVNPKEAKEKNSSNDNSPNLPPVPFILGRVQRKKSRRVTRTSPPPNVNSKKTTTPPTTKKNPQSDCQTTLRVIRENINNECCEASANTIEQLLDEIQEIKKKFEVSGLGSINMTGCESTLPYLLPWSGSGLHGIYAALERLSEATERVWEKIKCPPETNAAVPIAWETKTGEHPQLIILWKPSEGGHSRWSMHIPHPKKMISHTYDFNFPTYTKGAVRGSLVLNDNSKVVVNGQSEAECKKVLSYARSLIESSYLVGAREIFSKGGSTNKVQSVKAIYIKSFAGHLDQAPLWVKTL